MEDAVRTRPSRPHRDAMQISLLACLLAVDAVAQEPPPAPSPKPSAALQAAADELNALATEAEALVKKGDMAAAREVCQRALKLADLANASDAWLAAASDALWRLGLASYHAGDLQSAHDAWAAVHRHRTANLPNAHPDLLGSCMNLALTKKELGDLHGALALEEKVLSVLSTTLHEDHPKLQLVRLNLSSTKFKLGDLPGALALSEKVLAVHSRTVPEDHPDLQAARGNLALVKRALGDLPGALALQDQILEVLSRTLHDEHPDLQAARLNLASTKHMLRDLTGALALQEKVLSVRSKTLPDEHPDLQGARQNLALTKRELGDLAGALVLEEKVLTVRAKTLPDEHPDLQAARGNLAITKLALGDLPGALALQEKVLSVRSKTLPDEHPDLQDARGSLAITKRALGDLPGALALQEKALAILSKTLPDEHPDLQDERGSLAITKRLLGDLRGALALEEQVLAVRSRTLPDEHPELQRARINLAATKYALGDLPGALALQAPAFAVLAKTLPEDHPSLYEARAGLAIIKESLGDLQTAAQLHHSSVTSAAARLSASRFSTRDVVEQAFTASRPLSHAGSILDAIASTSTENAIPPKLATSITRDALALLTASRSAQEETTELLRQAHAAAPSAFDELRLAITKASMALKDAIDLPPEGRLATGARRVSRNDAIRDATLAKDAAERALLETIPEALRHSPRTKSFAAGLASNEVAIAFSTYTRLTHDKEHPWIHAIEPRFAAFALTPDGNVTWHSLAPVADVEPLIAAIRKDAEIGKRIATRSSIERPDSQPGRDPEDTTAKPDASTPRLTALRDLLIAPVLTALPKDTRRLVVSPADEMLLAPIEDLPLADGRTFGEAFEVQTVPSLRELVRKPKERAAEPRAFVVGGINYDQNPAKPAPTVPEAATPILEPIAAARKPADAQPDSTPRSGDQPSTRHFTALPGTTTEAEQLETLFAASFPTHPPTVLRKADASEAAFTELAPGKTFLHLATHGYFAPETYWKATDPRDDSPLARFDVGRNDRTAQLSPFSLTGIALAGANLPPDELGRREGILTAQEITRLDLTACYLATLSACNTTLGVRRGGTGLASLRQAFHAAGARFVLATLWEVDDAEAQKLMTDFYTRLWKNGEEPRSALRAAKRAARERGALFRDWAGWLITGR